jgi:hypothetical protein
MWVSWPKWCHRMFFYPAHSTQLRRLLCGGDTVERATHMVWILWQAGLRIRRSALVSSRVLQYCNAYSE